MYHPYTLRHMSYVYLQIFLTRQGNTSTTEASFLWSGCGRVVQGAGHKAKRLVLQCINNEFKSRRGKNKTLTAQKSNSNTVWFNLQTYIYIYIYIWQVFFLCFFKLYVMLVNYIMKSNVHPASSVQCFVDRQFVRLSFGHCIGCPSI